jgi:class 3 adenylate cyclase
MVAGTMEQLSQVTQEIARFFLLHLEEELRKPAVFMDVVRFDGRTPRSANAALIERLHAELPSLRSRAPAPYNLFRLWVERNHFVHGYDGYPYVAYNVIFAERLTCLLNWSPESRMRLHDVALDTFRKFDTRQPGFSIAFFLRVENNMRELLREVLDAMPDVDHEAVWAVLYQQSIEYQETINTFFEEALTAAHDQSERLLLNILPPSISEELKRTGRVKPVQIPDATVLFTDFADFTQISERMAPEALVEELDACFSLFDSVIEEHGLEKIKTIGDAYMCVAGAPDPRPTHAVDAARAALRMRDAIDVRRKEVESRGGSYWRVRIGLHCGSVTAGVIGRRKFSYDIWGDTVNIASRMESSGEPGRVNVSRAMRDRLDGLFTFQDRGRVAAKHKGVLEMFFLEEFAATARKGS